MHLRAATFRNALICAAALTAGSLAASTASAQGVGTYVSTYSGLSGNRNFSGYNFSTDSQFNIFQNAGGASSYIACATPCTTTHTGTADTTGHATASFNTASLSDIDQGGFSSGSGFSRADLATGELGGSATGTYRPVFGINSGINVRSFSTFGDHLDFTVANATGITDIAVNVVVHGELSEVNQYVNPTARSYLNFGGAYFDALIGLDAAGDQVLQRSGANYWDSYTITKLADGVMFTGIFGLRSGTTGIDIGEFLDVSCGAGSTCDFAHTAALTFTLPENVTFTSASGVFLSQVPGGGGAGGVPEPATWAMMILGLGGVGASLRRRRADLVTA